MPEPSPAPSTKCSPQAGFGAIAGITVSTTEKFLQGFQNTVGGAQVSITEELLTNFLQNADAFASQCCEKLASMLRQSSSQPEVRETTEPVLSRLVRNRCFESLDLILLDYVRLLQQFGVDLKQKASQLADSRLREAAKEVTPSNPAAGTAGPKILTQEGKARALVRMRDYLRGVDQLPQELLDYGAIKLFGGDVDYVLQKRYQQNIKEGIQERLGACLGVLASFDVLKQKMWEEQRAAETAAITAAAMVSVQSNVKRKGGFGSLIIGIACTGPAWFISATGARSPSLIAAAVLSGIVAIVFLYLGICRLAKG